MALGTGLVGESSKLGVGEVEASSAVGVPGAVGAVSAALAAVTDEEGDVGLLAVDSNNDTLAAVLGAAVGSLESSVGHGDKVVGVDVVEGAALDPRAHDRALVLVGEVGTAGLGLLDVVVVGTEALAREKGVGGRGTAGKDQGREGSERVLHGVEEQVDKTGKDS